MEEREVLRHLREEEENRATVQPKREGLQEGDVVVDNLLIVEVEAMNDEITARGREEGREQRQTRRRCDAKSEAALMRTMLLLASHSFILTSTIPTSSASSPSYLM
jgi:hypothetical protein